MDLIVRVLETLNDTKHSRTIHNLEEIMVLLCKLTSNQQQNVARAAKMHPNRAVIRDKN